MEYYIIRMKNGLLVEISPDEIINICDKKTIISCCKIYSPVYSGNRPPYKFCITLYDVDSPQ